MGLNLSWVGSQPAETPQEDSWEHFLTVRAIGKLESPRYISSRVRGGEPSWEVALAALSICQHKDHWSSAQSCLHCHSVWVMLGEQQQFLQLQWEEGGTMLCSFHLLSTC